MKKYILKFKDSKKVFGEYKSKEGASDKVIEYIHNYGCGHDHYISPFDFVLEEVEYKEVNEIITDFESAKKYLICKPNDDFISIRGRHYEDVVNVASLKNMEILFAQENIMYLGEMLVIH